MLRAYIPFLLLLGLVVFSAAMMLMMSHMLGPRRPTAVKGSAYESGIPPLGGARQRFSVKFYLTAMLFIVFDIETVFLFAWGAIYFDAGGSRSMGFLLVEMVVFLAILFVGYLYVWKRGGFEWD